MNIVRCDWANKTELERNYHDSSWGKPIHDDKELFKMLILEGKQAGLSWSTILIKMDTLCDAFDNFDPVKLVNYGEEKIQELMLNNGIIKNRLKVNAAIHNAKMYFLLCEKYGSLDDFLWGYVGYKPIINTWTSVTEVPAHTVLSDEISKQLKKDGFKFVGTTTIYALMQSIGMVNDHLMTCSFRNV